MDINDKISFKYSMGVTIALVLSIAWVLMIALVLSIAWVLIISLVLGIAQFNVRISFKYSMDVNDSISFK